MLEKKIIFRWKRDNIDPPGDIEGCVQPAGEEGGGEPRVLTHQHDIRPLHGHHGQGDQDYDLQADSGI